MMSKQYRNPALVMVASGLAALGWAKCNGTTLSSSALPDGSAAVIGPYGDLPADPVVAGGVMPAQGPTLALAFAGATSLATGGPCITEPAMGALFPSNFNSPLFEWVPPPGHNVFELTFHVPNQTNYLVVYTDQTSYTLPDEMWRALSADSADQDIAVQVRSSTLVAGTLTGGVASGTTGSIRIAPVAALGAIVYWTTSGGSALKGFRIGDKSVTPVLSPASLAAAGAPTTCIGCHVSTPDGSAALFGRSDPRFSLDVRLVDGTSRRPSWVKPTALLQLAVTDQAMGAMNRNLYSPPSRAIVVSPMNSLLTRNRYELVGTDLAASPGGFAIVQRRGDARQAATPVFNSNGTRLAYTSSDAVVDGRLGMGVGEIWTVPYNNGQGGSATALAGAADPTFNQYYPAYAPGDTFLAFNRIPRGTQMYNAAAAEIFLVPGAGGTPIRIVGNDPPACAGKLSPGQTNSWPHWSPSAAQSGTRRYYWLVFSSRRRPTALPQLYLSGVVTDTSSGAEVLLQTTPAVYLRNQPVNEANHTPAWDLFQIPGIG